MIILLYGVFWVAAYLALTLLPLIILIIGPTPVGRDFLLELSVTLAFAGLSIIGFQFLLTARIREIAEPYGIDVIYYFHRQVAIVGFLLILIHPIILFIRDSRSLALLNLVTAPWQARAGVTALLILIILMVMSLWRLPLKIPYEPWRYSHTLFAVAAVAVAMTHVMLANHYVNTPLKRAIWVLFALVWTSAVLYVRFARPLALLRRPYKVETVVEERGNAWTLVMKPDGHRGIRFQPGQFTWLTLWSSPFAMQEHPFSFSSSALNPNLVQLTIKRLGDFTAKIGELKPGTTVYLDGPYGAFTLDRYVAPGYVFIAGGIGITPIMSMVRTMADRNDLRPIILFYANKTLDGATYREELDELQNRLRLNVIHVLAEAPEGWEGESGFISAPLMARYLPEGRMQYEYFICGPPPMMNAVENALGQLGVPPEKLHSERFDFV